MKSSLVIYSTLYKRCFSLLIKTLNSKQICSKKKEHKNYIKKGKFRSPSVALLNLIYFITNYVSTVCI